MIVITISTTGTAQDREASYNSKQPLYAEIVTNALLN